MQDVGLVIKPVHALIDQLHVKVVDDPSHDETHFCIREAKGRRSALRPG